MRTVCFSLLFAACLVAANSAVFALPDPPDASKRPGKAVVGEVLGKLPLYFIENRGQMDERVDYYVQGADKTLYFTPDGITYTFTSTGGEGKESDATPMRWALKLDFVDSNPDAKPSGRSRQNAVVSYFRGKPDEWKTGIPTFGKLQYRNLWPGIDLNFHGDVHKLKYDFLVRPGNDPHRIILKYRGAKEVCITDQGRLAIKTPLGFLEDGKPYAYQEVDGERIEVPVKYALIEESADDEFSYGFNLGPYDPNKPLILDPVVYVYCGYIGGEEDDSGHGIALDGDRNAYIAGCTWSTQTTFPVKVGPDLDYNGSGSVGGDVFVAKVNAQGTDLVYCGYIGGSDTEYCFDIAVDSQGCAYVTGYTYSSEATFPVTVGPDLILNGDSDGFVAKVDSSGIDLDYCGYIGGDASGGESGYGIAVDGSGSAYVTGGTSSDESSFPVKAGPGTTYKGMTDAFVAKVNSSGSNFVYCGYIGGSSGDVGQGIAVDNAGHAFVTGHTSSSEATFPVKNGPDLLYNGGTDAFVAEVSSTGGSLLYCGYIGGDKEEDGEDIAVDADGNAYVAGWTKSTQSTFPVLTGPDLAHNGAKDVFVAKVNTGAALDYCGYIGGQYEDTGSGIAVDVQGNAYVVGTTKSTEATFPVVLGPDLTYNGGYSGDAFVAKVIASGVSLDFCGYVGGYNNEWGGGIAVDDHFRVYVTGSAASQEAYFPVVVGPDLFHNGNSDVFAAKMAMALVADPLSVSSSAGGTVNYILTAGVANANRNYLLLGSMTGTSPGTLLPGGLVTLPLVWDNFTNIIVQNLNGPVFTNFQSALDGEGNSTAPQFNLPPSSGFPPGSKLYFAYALNAPWDFASNPVTIDVLP